MPIIHALTCTGTGCLAMHLGRPGGTPGDVVTAAAAHGWDADRCPSCARGGLPVLELGDCPACAGTTYAAQLHDRCHYCGHATPYPDDDDVQEDDVEPDDQEQQR